MCSYLQIYRYATYYSAEINMFQFIILNPRLSHVSMCIFIAIPIMSLEFLDHSNHSFVEEDAQVQMECIIRADPPVIDVTWHHNDNILREDRSRGILFRNWTIEIERVKKEHRGKYRCFATNAIGRGSSNYAQLDILCK